MSTEIYYFSGTGNSLHVAQELQRRIPETSLVPVVSLLDRESIETRAEAVGLICPQYASTMPKVMERIVKKTDFASAKYIFSIVTRGGTQCSVFSQVDEILERKNRRLDSYFVLNMPSGSEPLVETFGEYITEERIARLESEMLQRLDSIQTTITEHKTSRDEDLSGLDVPPPDCIKPLMPFIKILGPILLPLGKLAERSFEFYFDEKCTGCGLCERVCLAQKIKMVDGRPIWQKRAECFGCFACLNYCPEQSIQVASTWYLKSCTTENGRYHHPQVTAKDIAGQKAFYSLSSKAI